MKKWRRLLKGFMPLLLGGCLLINGSRQRVDLEPESPPRVPEEPAGTSLPALDSDRSSITVPSPDPVPPEMSYHEALKQLNSVFPSQLAPLIIKGRRPLFLHDLNKDDQPEGFSLGISSQELDRSEIDQLSEYSRLFQGDNRAVEFYLLFFGNDQGKLYPVQTHSLGRRHAYESFQKVHLDNNRSSPIIITVSFYTLEGTEQELFVFDNASGIPAFRISLINTLSINSKLMDIDGDGLLDLFIKERGMEEGTGLETFLTWYRWNGKSYTEIRSRNVVRNLKAFLKQVKELLQTGYIHQLMDLAIDPKLAAKLRKQGLNDTTILASCLGLDRISVSELPEIREVVFPEILEDPFTVQDQLGSSFRLTFRIVDKNGISHIADALLYMPRNPFGEKQFMFYPD
ncbi:hypothetical protein ES703_83787 [subsurface metagenome]